MEPLKLMLGKMLSIEFNIKTDPDGHNNLQLNKKYNKMSNNLMIKINQTLLLIERNNWESNKKLSFASNAKKH